MPGKPAKMFKITLTDENDEVVFEKTEKERGWAIAVLYSDGLESAMDKFDQNDYINKLTITAERVQTDVAPPDPIKQDPATPETDTIDDDEEEDEEENDDLAMMRDEEDPPDDPPFKSARMAVEPDNPDTTGFNEATGDYKTPTEAA